MTVEYYFEPHKCDKENMGPWKNFTTDISYSGIGLFSECPAEQGQVIKIFLRHVFEDPVMGEIRWCTPDRNDLYRLGVRFI